MDFPILRYVDVVIGVAVIVLLACTVVTAITKLLLSGTFLRARNLRDALTELISQVDPKTLKPHASYIAERLLRHPLVARDNTFFGHVAWRIRARWRKRQSSMPLPGLNLADTIQREEVIMLLLEWAGKDGALGAQDDSLLDDGHMTEASNENLQRLHAGGESHRVHNVKTGTDSRHLMLNLAEAPLLEKVESAIRMSNSPLTIYRQGGCLLFAAQNPEADRIAIFEDGATHSISGISAPGVGRPSHMTVEAVVIHIIVGSQSSADATFLFITRLFKPLLTDPASVYALRWMAGRQAGEGASPERPEFARFLHCEPKEHYGRQRQRRSGARQWNRGT